MLTLDNIKYELLKPFCSLSITEFESDEEWAIERAADFVAPQLTYETKCQKIVCIKNIL